MEPNDLEHEVLRNWRNGNGVGPAVPSTGDVDSWIPLALRLSLLASRLVRSARLSDLDQSVRLKHDGSPVSGLEHHIEEVLGKELERASLAVTLVGEENGHGDPGSGTVLAVDPVDGTWSLVNRVETAATSLALLHDGLPFLGVVSNPATGEIAYAVQGRVPRLLQLGTFGEPDYAVNLPIPAAGPEGLLVNLHPQRAALSVMSALARAWRDGELDMLRSSGGAPSLGLLEAAKGSFVYVNLWNRRESEPWDLWPGLMLLRAAGGEAIDLRGEPIRGTGHRGPFVAALDERDRGRVAAIIRRATSQSGS